MKLRTVRTFLCSVCLSGGLLCCSCDAKRPGEKSAGETKPLVATDLLPAPERDKDQPASQESPAAAAAAPRAFDRLHDVYAPIVDASDPLAFPMKVRSLAQSPIGMWRGGKDLFYRWCKTNAADWLEDREAFVTQEGDQHLGNVGTYLTAGEQFGTVAFGMVDYDETARLPFQYELLQGLITLQLTAASAGVELSERDVQKLTDLLFEEYRNAANSSRTAAEILRGDGWVKKLFSARDKVDYGKELRLYVTNQRFTAARINKKGEVKDILRPADDRADELAKGIADALSRDPEAAKLFRETDAASIRKRIRAVALRTRLGSAGSQGLKKYFVLLDKPIVDVGLDIILYMKQQVPSAAERSGLIPNDPRSPAQRAAEDSRLLDHPAPLLSSWCEIGTESYWVAFREPWTKELDADEVKSVDDLFQAARIWAVAAGTSHHEPGQAKMIAERMTPELGERMQKVSSDYIGQVRADYTDFSADPRVKKLLATAEEAIKDATVNVSPED